jgi:GxxExxY protein
MDRDALEALATQVVDSAVEVHRALGPGLLESAYESVLCTEFAQREIPFERQVPLPVNYKGTVVDCGYRIDVLVSSEIVLELKAVERMLPVHEAQTLSYLKLSGKPLAFLINFHTPRLKDGLKRFANFNVLPPKLDRPNLNP